LGVVIPTHNRAALLRRAVASVPPDVEVVVVDDGSTDETPSVARRIGNRIAYVRLPMSAGPGPARNVGIDECTSDRVLFLDDDDVLLPEGVERIQQVIASHPEVALHLHNCVWSSGEISIPQETPVTPLSLHEWLQGRFAGELKPVARRDVFEKHRFEDTGASGEALLWGQVIREFGAVVSGAPVVFYDVSRDDRLTSMTGLLSRASQNAAIARRWLALFGAEQRAVAPERWRTRVHAAVLYSALAGDRATARDIAASEPLDGWSHLVACGLAVMPARLLRGTFRLRLAIRSLRTAATARGRGTGDSSIATRAAAR
jgi:hypothetical protein